MVLTGLSILGDSSGQPGGEPVHAMNATTGEALHPAFYPASAEDIETATRLAAGASIEYGGWSAIRRSALLRKIAELLDGSSEEIIERAHLETALPLPRLHHEMERTCGQLRLFAKLIEEGWWQDARIDHADPNRTPFPKPDVRSMLIPLGPVAILGASNFPLASSVAGGDTASALAAGCPVIVKAHEAHPGTSELVGQLIRKAVHESGAPAGVFSMVQGQRDIGTALVTHPTIQAVGFTGSLRAGRAIMDAAAARPRPIPVFAEMGSVNPVFISQGALDERAEQIATRLQAAITLGVGQFCTNPGVVFLPAGGVSAFIEKLAALMQNSPPGTMLTANICAAFQEGLARLSKTPGVREISRVSAGEGLAGAALFATDAATFLQYPALAEEVFGPSSLLVQYFSHAEMVECARKLEGQLTATIHAEPQELDAHRDLLAILQTKAGRVLWNGFPPGVEVCHAMQHGGPYPASSDSRSTSIGTRALTRFARPACFQDFPDAALPDELKNANPLGLTRMVNGKFGRH